MKLRRERQIVFVSIAEQVYTFLEEDIVAGTYPPGSRIDLEAIEKSLRISRIPIRDALERLIEKGLVRKVPRIGYYVVKPTVAELRDLFGVRRMMEEYALSLGVSGIDRSFAVELRDRMAKYGGRAEFSAEETADLLELDLMLHRDLIIGNSGSPMLDKLYEGIKAKVNLVAHLAYRLDADVREHLDILEAILEGDQNHAVRCLRVHLAATEENTVQYAITKESQQWQSTISPP